MEQRSLKEVLDTMNARLDEYYAANPDAAKAHRAEKRRRALKSYLGGFVSFMVIIVLPLVLDFWHPKLIPLLCWLNLSVICEVP
jgi:hypothetical protein